MVSKRSAPFFKRLLTSRHLLTRRSLAIVWGGSLAILVPVLWWRMPASSPKPFDGHSRPVQLVSNAAEAVTVLTARVGDAGPAYMQQSFTGIVKPRRSSWLAAKAIGRVNKIWAEMGDPIAAGELLIELDLATLDAQRATTTARLAAAQAQWNELQQGPRHQDIDQAVERVTEISATLQLSEANFRRMESLANSNSISRQELDEAKFTLEATRAQLAAARHALDLLREGTRQEQLSAAEATVRGLQAELQHIEVQIAEQSIYAPYAGKIQDRMVDEGTVVSPGEPLLQIVESGAMEIHVGLPPELVSRLRPSDLSITIEGRQIPVAIARTSPSINEATRTREVVFNISASASEDVIFGNAVNVEIRTPIDTNPSSNGGSFWVPRESLTAAARGLWAVFIAVPISNEQKSADPPRLYEIERRQVELLRSQGGWSEVRGPLVADEQLVIAGEHRIVQGQVVVLSHQQTH